MTLKISGWVRKVFVDSIGRPVRKGEPLFTVYSPDLLATQDEYLLAIKTRAQLAESPLDEAKASADALVASARERLRLWDVTDSQIAALERRGQADPVLTVYAPSSGIVMKREALPGKYGAGHDTVRNRGSFHSLDLCRYLRIRSGCRKSRSADNGHLLPPIREKRSAAR
ncbi:MAG: efflux RND transporter periplasmic adaptor subunit [Nitrospira sp.]